MKTSALRVVSSVIACLSSVALAACPDASSPGADVSVAADVPADTATSDVDAVSDTTSMAPEEALAATIAALCPRYAARYCEETERCGCTQVPGFPDNCVATFMASCEARLQAYLTFVQSGEAVYRPDNADVCLAALEPVYAACVPLRSANFFGTCPILTPPGGFTSLPAAGESCEGLCQLPLVCGTDSTCRAPGQLDAACDSPDDCDATLTCIDNTCQALRLDNQGTSCASPDDCSGETTCLASIRKLCRPAAASGPCRYDEDCVAGAYCAVDTDGGTEDGVCTPAGALGEPCGNGVVCAEGLACDSFGGTCAALPGSGMPCAQGPMGPVVCGEGLSCLNGTCGAPPTEGMPCAMGSPHCAAGLGCAFEGEENLCRARVGPGSPCANDETCRDDAFCDFNRNVCEAIRAVGEPCANGNECGPAGACLPDAVFNFRCAPKPQDGDACLLDECGAGLVCRTPYTAGVCAPPLCEAIRF